MHRGTYSESMTVRLIRNHHLIEIESPDASVTFHPLDFDKTYKAIISKCNELYLGYQFSDTELRDIDVQLTEIYKDYSEEINIKSVMLSI